MPRALVLAVFYCLTSTASAGIDPRGDITLRWTAPPDSAGGAAAEYSLRTSTFAPGSNLEAWWSLASPQNALPIPGTPGTLQVWHHSGFEPGTTVHMALKSADQENDWSDISNVVSWEPPGLPLVTGVSPREFGHGSNTVTISGYGVDTATLVRVYYGSDFVTATGLTAQGDDLVCNVQLPAEAEGALEIYVLNSDGSDWLRGWVFVGEGAGPPPPPPPTDMPPASVTDLQARYMGFTSVLLTWTAPSDDVPINGFPVTAYDVRNLVGSPGDWQWFGGSQLISSHPGVPGTSESLLVGGLIAGQTYAFAMKSQDAAGLWSNQSNTVQITLPQPPPEGDPPTTVTDLTVTEISSDSLRVTWTAPSDPEAGNGPVADHSLRFMAGSPDGWYWQDGADVPIGSPGSPGTQEEVVFAVESGVTIALAYKSQGATGVWSALSNVVALTPGVPAPPGAASEFGVTLSDNTAILSWLAPQEPVTLWHVRRHDGDAASFDWGTAQVVPAPSAGEVGAALQISGGLVNAGEMACFAVMSEDAYGQLSAMAGPIVLDRSGEDAVAPLLEQSLVSVRSFGNGAQVQWRAPGDDGALGGRVDYYRFVVAENPDVFVDWWMLESPIVLGTPKAPGKLEFQNVNSLQGPGTVYGFAIQAVDDAGLESEWITVLYTVTGGEAIDTAPPLPPSNVATSWSGSGFLVSWSAPPDADVESYRIYKADSHSPEGVQIAEVGASITSLEDITSFSAGIRYAITAVDAHGNESVGEWAVTVLPSDSPSVRSVPQGWAVDIPAPLSPAPSIPRVMVFDVMGRRVAEPLVLNAPAGWTAVWNGESPSGRAPSGVYFVRVSTNGKVSSHKLLLVR